MEETPRVDFIRFLCISFRTQGAVFLAPAACLPVTNPINKLRWGCEVVQRAIADFVRFHCPLVASAEAIPPATKNTTPLAGESCCINKSTALLERPAVRSRSCARQYEAGRKSYLGAHLRMRKVTGRDASLPAPWLATSFGAVARERGGALPQTPQGSSAP